LHRADDGDPVEGPDERSESPEPGDHVVRDWQVGEVRQCLGLAGWAAVDQHAVGLGAAHPRVPRDAEDAATALAVDPSDLQGVGTSAAHLLATLLTGAGAEDRAEQTATHLASLDVQAGPRAGDHQPLTAVVQPE